MDSYRALLEERMAVVEAEKQAEVCTKAQVAGWERILHSGRKIHRIAD